MGPPKSFHGGYDYFTPAPGTETEMLCKACGAQMDVERNMNVFGRFGHVRVADIFSCPFSGERWHEQVIALLVFQRQLPSKKLCDLVSEEIAEIIKSKTPSKEAWSI